MNSRYTDFRMLHLKRSLTSSRSYLILGLAIPIMVMLLLFLEGRSIPGSTIARTYGLPASTSGGAVLVATLAPAIIPLAAVIGSFSPLLLFVNDRSRGVYEYLLAYGKKPSDIFSALILSVLIISVILTTVPLTLSAVLIYLTGPFLLPPFADEAVIYVLPVSLVAPLFVSGIAATWVSLTKRVQFVNSPIGIAPMFGLAPVLLVLLISQLDRGKDVLIVMGVASVLMVVATAAIFLLAARLLRGERFIV